MISADDLDAFAAENGPAIAQAATFARRCERGLPPDRWATTAEMHQVARGIWALTRLVAIQTALLADLADAPTETGG